MEEINHTVPNPKPNDSEERKDVNDEKAIRQHDRFVRYALQHRTLFIAFLAKYLPAHVLGLIDLEKAQLCKPSTIDRSLRERIADACLSDSTQKRQWTHPHLYRAPVHPQA